MIEMDYTKVICQTSSLRRAHDRTRALNEAMPVTIITKMVNGREVQQPRKAKAVTGSVEATLERLIKNYVREHHKLLRTVGEPAFDAGMPPLRVSRPQLALQRTIGEKTAYNHLQKLQKLGFITEKKFRGSKHAFEIWIDPTLLFQPERHGEIPQPKSFSKWAENSSESGSAESAKNASDGAETANFAAYKVIENSSFEETEILKEEGCGQGNAQSKQGNKNQGNTEHPAPNPRQNGRLEEQGPVGNLAPGGGAPILTSQQPKPGLGQRLKAKLTKADLDKNNQAARTPEQRQAILHGYVRSFWTYAKDTLYAAKTFSDGENRLILNAVWAGVYNSGKSTMDEKGWDNYQRDLYQRIDLAARYYNRNPDKWIPAPYAEYRTGSGYFDWANERGFRQTEFWLSENRRKQKKDRVSQVVGQAIKHLHQHRDGRAPKALEKMTYIEAYRHLEAKMTKHSPLAHQKFLKLASVIDQPKPKLTPGFTQNFKK